MRRPTRNNPEAGRRLGRRALLLGGVQLGVIGMLGWRMQSMQVDQAEDFRLLAEENRINLRLLPPTRGIIYDINGVALAENEQNYRIVLRREDAGDVDMVLERLARLMPIDPAILERTREEALARPSFTPVTVMDRVS